MAVEDRFSLPGLKQGNKIKPNLNVFLILSVVIAAFASMGDLTLSIGEASNITVLVIFLFVISRMVYHDIFVENMDEARKSEEYKAAKSEFDEISNKVYESKLVSKLPLLCARYCEEELKHRRTLILLNTGIDYETYEKKYRDKSKEDLIKLGLTKTTVKSISKANKAKNMNLSSDILLSDEMDSVNMQDPRKMSADRKQFAAELKSGITAFLKTTLVGVISISVAFDFSLESVAQWAIRMMPIVTAALSAGPAGRRNVFKYEIPYIKIRTYILKVILDYGARGITEQEIPESKNNA